MAKPEEQTAYERFLTQSKQELHSKPKRDPGLLNYRDITNSLEGIARKQTVTFVTNRFLYVSVASVVLVILGHITLQVQNGSIVTELENGKLEFDSRVSQIVGLPESSRAEVQIESGKTLQADKASVRKQTIWVQLGAGVLSLFTVLFSIGAYRDAMRRLSGSSYLSQASELAHNFMLWKLRSPSNSSEYSVFHDFDQIESDDVDYPQLKELFSNACYSGNRRGLVDYFLAPIAALPIAFVPVYGVGLYMVLVGFVLSLSLSRHVDFIGAIDCLSKIPEPIAALHAQ